MENKEVLEQVLKETNLRKKPKESEEGFVFEITEEEFEKAIKRTIELLK